MDEKRYIYANIGIGYEILDSWFGYTGDDEPTEREIEEYDYLVIGLASNQDAAEGICRRLNDQQDEINHLSNFGLHVILDKKNKEIKQLKEENKEFMELDENRKEYQRTLESKIRRLKDRVKTFEKHYSLKDIERYKQMDNPNMITHKRLWGVKRYE